MTAAARRTAAALVAAFLFLGTVLIAGASSTASTPDIGWDEHTDSYISNGQAVHPPHTHPPVVREPMPEWAPVEGERLITVERVAGADRYETAVLLNQLTDAGVSFAFLVNGANPVDALPAAATNLGPVFYVPPTGTASRDVLDELYHLQPDVIIVIGGPGVISDDVLASITVIRP